MSSGGEHWKALLLELIEAVEAAALDHIEWCSKDNRTAPCDCGIDEIREVLDKCRKETK